MKSEISKNRTKIFLISNAVISCFANLCLFFSDCYNDRGLKGINKGVTFL